VIPVRTISLILTASLILPATALAQRNNELKNGVELAVTESYGTTMKGRIVSVSTDSITIVARGSGSGGVFHTIALRDVRSMKVKHVSHARGLFMGALIGTAVGALSGAIIGGADSSCNFFACGRAENAAFAAALFGTGGLTLGSLFGVAAGWPSWKTVTP
jgi:hypothetical protein